MLNGLNVNINSTVTAHQSSADADHAAIMRGLQLYSSIGEMRAATPLPKNTQEVIDNAVIRTGRQRLAILDDLINEGLTEPLPNWMSVPTLTSHKVNEAGRAKRSMVPKSRGERFVMDYVPFTIPITVTWDDFSFNARELAAAARVGAPLDVSHVEQATRNVNEQLEDTTINGGITIDGNSTLGLLNTTNTQAYVDNQAWDHADHSGEDILQDVINMIEVAQADRFYGPYNLYIPSNYGLKLSFDFKANGTTTIRQRLEEINVGGRPLRIRTVDFLPTNRTLLVQMTRDVVDVIMGQTPTVVSWSDGPGWERFFVVLACVVPRIKSNYEGNFGIVAGNTT